MGSQRDHWQVSAIASIDSNSYGLICASWWRQGCSRKESWSKLLQYACLAYWDWGLKYEPKLTDSRWVVSTLRLSQFTKERDWAIDSNRGTSLWLFNWHKAERLKPWQWATLHGWSETMLLDWRLVVGCEIRAEDLASWRLHWLLR